MQLKSYCCSMLIVAAAAATFRPVSAPARLCCSTSPPEELPFCLHVCRHFFCFRSACSTGSSSFSPYYYSTALATCARLTLCCAVVNTLTCLCSPPILLFKAIMAAVAAAEMSVCARRRRPIRSLYLRPYPFNHSLLSLHLRMSFSVDLS